MTPDNTARVCVPVCEKSLSALKEACQKASSVADVVELRLDCLDETELAGAAANIKRQIRIGAVIFFRSVNPQRP